MLKENKFYYQDVLYVVDEPSMNGTIMQCTVRAIPTLTDMESLGRMYLDISYNSPYLQIEISRILEGYTVVNDPMVNQVSNSPLEYNMIYDIWSTEQLRRHMVQNTYELGNIKLQRHYTIPLPINNITENCPVMVRAVYFKNTDGSRNVPEIAMTVKVYSIDAERLHATDQRGYRSLLKMIHNIAYARIEEIIPALKGIFHTWVYTVLEYFEPHGIELHYRFLLKQIGGAKIDKISIAGASIYMDGDWQTRYGTLEEFINIDEPAKYVTLPDIYSMLYSNPYGAKWTVPIAMATTTNFGIEGNVVAEIHLLCAAMLFQPGIYEEGYADFSKYDTIERGDYSITVHHLIGKDQKVSDKYLTFDQMVVVPYIRTDDSYDIIIPEEVIEWLIETYGEDVYTKFNVLFNSRCEEQLYIYPINPQVDFAPVKEDISKISEVAEENEEDEEDEDITDNSDDIITADKYGSIQLDEPSKKEDDGQTSFPAYIQTFFSRFKPKKGR